MFFPTETFDFGDIPVLSYLNGIDGMWAYGGVIGLSTLGLSFGGDFVGMFLKDKSFYPRVVKLTRPVSAGILSSGIALGLSGFDMSLMGVGQMFLLGAMSNVLGQYLSNVVFPYQSKLMDQLNSISMSQPDIPDSMPIIDKQSNFNDILPFKQMDFGGFAIY